jgi:hypothetical protein
MLIEKLFFWGVMTMGPSKTDEWNHENRVPSTRLSPAYADVDGRWTLL